MTYWDFHSIFNFPIILIFGVFLFLIKPTKHFYRGVALLSAVAFIYTTPWDNYLLYKEVWSYIPENISFTVGYVPIEEYAFFILQTLIMGALLFFMQRKLSIQGKWTFKVSKKIALLTVILTALSALLLLKNSTLYLGLILVWAMPVALLQWILGKDILVKNLKLYLTTLSIGTIYYCLADAYAIDKNVWFISKEFTTNIFIGNLPIEEAIFFLFTNILVLQGLILFWSVFSPNTSRNKTT